MREDQVLEWQAVAAAAPPDGLYVLPIDRPAEERALPLADAAVLWGSAAGLLTVLLALAQLGIG